MTGYLASLLMGLVVGGIYGLVQVRSPAPPMIALVGLFGMLLGQQAIDIAKKTFLTSEAYIYPARDGRCRGGALTRLIARTAH